MKYEHDLMDHDSLKIFMFTRNLKLRANNSWIYSILKRFLSGLKLQCVTSFGVVAIVINNHSEEPLTEFCQMKYEHDLMDHDSLKIFMFTRNLKLRANNSWIYSIFQVSVSSELSKCVPAFGLDFTNDISAFGYSGPRNAFIVVLWRVWLLFLWREKSCHGRITCSSYWKLKLRANNSWIYYINRVLSQSSETIMCGLIWRCSNSYSQ